MMKKLPQRPLEKQESERTATAAAVTDAIIELEAQGYNTRIKDLMFVTGLSRSVFAKRIYARFWLSMALLSRETLNPQQ